MPKFAPQYRRLLMIDSKLRDQSFPNCRSLADDWEVSSKTIQRDMDYLRDALGAPILYDAIRHGYYYSEPNYSLPTMNISESDLFAVFIAEQALKRFENTPIHGQLSGIFSKIAAALPDRIDVRPSWIDNRILFIAEPSTKVDPGVWNVIADALRESRSLQITHQSPRRDKASSRKIDPYYLVNYRGEWYLNSYCHRSREARTFGVSRISEARLLDARFEMPSDYDSASAFGDEFGIISGDDPRQVELLFSPEVAPYIGERDWFRSQKLTSNPDGSITLSFKTTHLNEVKDWILSWGPMVEVLAPQQLIESLRRALQQALALYDKVGPHQARPGGAED